MTINRSDGRVLLVQIACARSIATSRRSRTHTNTHQQLLDLKPPNHLPLLIVLIVASQLRVYLYAPALLCSTLVLPSPSLGVATADPVLHMVCSGDPVPDGFRRCHVPSLFSPGSLGGYFACDFGPVGLCSSPALRPCLHPRQSVRTFERIFDKQQFLCRTRPTDCQPRHGQRQCRFPTRGGSIWRRIISVAGIDGRLGGRTQC